MAVINGIQHTRKTRKRRKNKETRVGRITTPQKKHKVECSRHNKVNKRSRAIVVERKGIVCHSVQ